MVTIIKNEIDFYCLFKFNTWGEQLIHVSNWCFVAGVNKKRCQKCLQHCVESHRETNPGEEQGT